MEQEITCSAIRAMGSGGQNVNKVSSAIHLRFDIRSSSLSEKNKIKLLNWADSRINKDGVVIIKAQSFRTQEQNKDDAIQRLAELIAKATFEDKHRKATRPTFASKKRRLEGKKKTGATKNLRGKVKF